LFRLTVESVLRLAFAAWILIIFFVIVVPVVVVVAVFVVVAVVLSVEYCFKEPTYDEGFKLLLFSSKEVGIIIWANAYFLLWKAP
jgi:hypothetical protein